MIHKNNVVFTQQLVNDIIKYKQTKQIPANQVKEFKAIADALEVIDGNLILNHHGIYTIIPVEKVNDKLNELMQDPATMVRGRDWLYVRVRDLKLIGISRPAIMKFLEHDTVHQTHQRIKRLKVQKPIVNLSR